MLKRCMGRGRVLTESRWHALLLLLMLLYLCVFPHLGKQCSPTLCTLLLLLQILRRT